MADENKTTEQAARSAKDAGEETQLMNPLEFPKTDAVAAQTATSEQQTQETMAMSSAAKADPSETTVMRSPLEDVRDTAQDARDAEQGAAQAAPAVQEDEDEPTVVGMNPVYEDDAYGSDPAETMYLGQPIESPDQYGNGGGRDDSDTGEYPAYPQGYGYAPSYDDGNGLYYNDYAPEGGYDFTRAQGAQNPADVQATMLQQPVVQPASYQQQPMVPAGADPEPAAGVAGAAGAGVAGLAAASAAGQESDVPVTEAAKKKHRAAWIWIIVVLALLAAVCGFGWHKWRQNAKESALADCQEAAQSLSSANASVKSAIQNAQNETSAASDSVTDPAALATLQKDVATTIPAVEACPASASASTLSENASTMNSQSSTMSSLAAKIKTDAEAVLSSQNAKSVDIARQALKDDLAIAVQTLAADTDKVASSSTTQALQQAVSQAQSLVNSQSASVDQLTTARATLDQAMSAANASAQQYQEEQEAAQAAQQQAQQQSQNNTSNNSSTMNGTSTSNNATTSNSDAANGATNSSNTKNPTSNGAANSATPSPTTNNNTATTMSPSSTAPTQTVKK